MGRKRYGASTAARRATVLGGLLLLWLGVLTGACRESLGTALFVTVDFPSALTMDQLRVSGTVADSGIGPHLVPEQPGRPLTSGDTFRVLVPGAPDKAEAELSVEGLREGSRVAFGTQQVQIEEGSDVDVTVLLERLIPPDGGTPDAGIPDGGFCPNCASGCCMAGYCATSTFNTCGTGGIACVMCTPQTADSCVAAGYCSCGRGPACNPTTSDRCQLGLCRCGTSGSCTGTQQCVSGKCK